MNKEDKYWIALSSLQKHGIEKINRLLVDIYNTGNYSINEFVEGKEVKVSSDRKFTSEELEIFRRTLTNDIKAEPIALELEKHGIEIIPIVSKEYSSALKRYLKTKSSPPVLFVKGDKSLLNEPSSGIVGSRNASDVSLAFTDMISRKLVKEGKVIVSGYARGVDRKALESALDENGKSIIVLPQGILTFLSEIKKLSSYIDDGRLLVLSTFFPKSPWSVGLAMARNSTIYGLAEEIYVAESGSSGGTWTGVLEGLKRGMKIYMRVPFVSETNANRELISRGAIPFNMAKSEIYDNISREMSVVSDSKMSDQEQLILNSLKKSAKTSREIIDELGLDWSAKRLTDYLSLIKKVEVIKGRPRKYVIKTEDPQEVLFK